MTQRITFSIDDKLMHALDRMISDRGYVSRSEAFRDMARAGLKQATEDSLDAGYCVATLTYVYKHSTRELPRRLTRAFHDHVGLSLSTLRLHLDGEMCLEVNVLRGKSSAIKRFADRVITEPGVHYGRVIMVPIDETKRANRTPRGRTEVANSSGRTNGSSRRRNVP